MIVYDSRNSYFKSPFGAIPTEESITFRLVLPSVYKTVSLIIRNDTGYMLKKPMDLEASSRYSNTFIVQLNQQFTGIFFYMFDLGYEGDGIYKGERGEGVIAKNGNWYQLTVYDKNFTTPSSLKGKTFYQIFPDRFNKSDKTKRAFIKNRYYIDNLNATPFYQNKNITTDYFGGNLQGIIEKLDYLKTLNISFIYLNPIFEAHSNHRYNTADFFKIDPDLGSLDDFNELVQKADSLGIKIILDGVFSHVGSDSIYFNKENRYSSLGAYNSKNSPYYSWFDFDRKYKSGYRAWWDFASLPEINEFNKNYIEYICGKDGVIQYWINKGIAGFRLDVADELPDEFIAELRKAVKRNSEENFIVGEVWEDASNKVSFGKRRTYLLGSGLDSVMNYPFKDYILKFIKTNNSDEFCQEVLTIIENYPKPAVDVTLNSLSTHDTIRAITYIGSENPFIENREIQSKTFLSLEEYQKAKKLLVLAYAMLFTLPGIPCIYYGDEIGMQGYKDPFNRRFFEWDKIDSTILDAIKDISAKRENNSIFKEGRLHFIHSAHGSVGYVRFDKEKETLIVINAQDTELVIEYSFKSYTIPSSSYLIEKIKGY